jgi:hypothetical protein
VKKTCILNLEIKPLGFTPLQQCKDRLKVQLCACGSINQLLETKGGPAEVVLFANAGKYKITIMLYIPVQRY